MSNMFGSIKQNPILLMNYFIDIYDTSNMRGKVAVKISKKSTLSSMINFFEEIALIINVNGRN